nr:hypothetical protein [Tanacetum cinerariifolium]
VVVCAGEEWWRSWGVVGEVENGWESGENGLVMLAGKTGEVAVGLNVGKKGGYYFGFYIVSPCCLLRTYTVSPYGFKCFGLRQK